MQNGAIFYASKYGSTEQYAHWIADELDIPVFDIRRDPETPAAYDFALIAVPALSGWQLVTLISPLFVYVLLTRISGIPLLESRSDAKWGDDPDYQAYKAGTPGLWLRPPASP